MLALAFGWTLPLGAALVWTVFVLATMLVPNLIPAISGLFARRPGVSLSSHARAAGSDFGLALALTALNVVFLPDQAFMLGDAIVRTLWRLFVSRRHLLEWTTASRAMGARRLTPGGFALRMIGALAISVAALVLALAFGRGVWPVAGPVVVLWLASPAVAWAVSRPPTPERRDEPFQRTGSGASRRRASDLAIFRDFRDCGRK